MLGKQFNFVSVSDNRKFNHEYVCGFCSLRTTISVIKSRIVMWMRNSNLASNVKYIEHVSNIKERAYLRDLGRDERIILENIVLIKKHNNKLSQRYRTPGR